MRIDSIELYLVENRFYRPWRTAYGSDAGNCVLITRMRSGDHEGWSETSALSGPNYSYEYGEGMFIVARRFLAPALIGRSFESARELNAAMAHVKERLLQKRALKSPGGRFPQTLRACRLGSCSAGRLRPSKSGTAGVLRTAMTS